MFYGFFALLALKSLLVDISSFQKVLIRDAVRAENLQASQYNQSSIEQMSFNSWCFHLQQIFEYQENISSQEVSLVSSSHYIRWEERLSTTISDVFLFVIRFYSFSVVFFLFVNLPFNNKIQCVSSITSKIFDTRPAWKNFIRSLSKIKSELITFLYGLPIINLQINDCKKKQYISTVMKIILIEAHYISWSTMAVLIIHHRYPALALLGSNFCLIIEQSTWHLNLIRVK